MATPSYDFGYDWRWTHGHLIPFAVFALLLFLSIRLKWRWWIAAVSSGLALWSLCGFLIVWFGLIPNRPLELPTERFLTGGSGKVLDAGAGSGRSTLMVVLARPGATAVALDRFGDGYGIEGNSPERLLANMRAAGVASRVEAKVGDMREMPFAAETFDGAVSAYAIDHLSREGTARALDEVKRVLKPRGEFLLMVINRDRWVATAYPFLHGHGYFGREPARNRWRSLVDTAGFDVVEDGTTPGTLYVLCRKRG